MAISQGWQRTARLLTGGLAALALGAAALTAGTPAAAATAAPGASTAEASAAPAKLPTTDSLAPKGAPTLSTGSGSTPAQQAAMSAASAQARSSGRAVVVGALTTPTLQVSALPGGRFEVSDNPLPVRALRGGSWVPVDTSLVRDGDGSYSAAATAYASVTFSGGGSAPLVTTSTASGQSYQLSWPGVLPVPSVSGSTATYPGVLPGVDLQVSADAGGGFSEVLVVHSAAAAANPELAKLTLAARSSGGADASSGTLVSGGGWSLQASSALEWD